MKRYLIQHEEYDWNFIISIDEDKLNMRKIKEMVEFWAGWKDIVEDCHGDYLKAFLKTLALDLFSKSASGQDSEEIIYMFKSGTVEGYYPLNEDTGIQIERLSNFYLDAIPEEFQVEEI